MVLSPRTAALAILSDAESAMWRAVDGGDYYSIEGMPVTFMDTSLMAREAIRKAQWRKLASRLPAGVQVPPPEGAS